AMYHKNTRHPALTADQIAAQRHLSLSRRRFLRGVGACMALPALESMASRGALASLPEAAGPVGATAASGAPTRMAFVYFPNGAHQANWWPTGEGKDFVLAK